MIHYKIGLTKVVIVFVLINVMAMSSCSKDETPVPLTAAKISMPKVYGELGSLKHSDPSGTSYGMHAAFWNGGPIKDSLNPIFPDSIYYEGSKIHRTSYGFGLYHSVADSEPFDWEIFGSSQVPSFKHRFTLRRPIVSKIKCASYIDLSKNFVINLDTVLNIDSMSVMLGSNVVFSIPGISKQFIIPKSQLPAQPGIYTLSVSAFRLEHKVIAGNEYTFFAQVSNSLFLEAK